MPFTTTEPLSGGSMMVMEPTSTNGKSSVSLSLAATFVISTVFGSMLSMSPSATGGSFTGCTSMKAVAMSQSPAGSHTW